MHNKGLVWELVWKLVWELVPLFFENKLLLYQIRYESNLFEGQGKIKQCPSISHKGNLCGIPFYMKIVTFENHSRIWHLLC